MLSILKQINVARKYNYTDSNQSACIDEARDTIKPPNTKTE